MIKLYNEAIDSKTAKNVKDFFKEFKKTHGLPWPTTLSLDEVTRAEILSKEGSTSRLGDRDLGIMKKLEEFRIEDLSKNPETPETESQEE